MLQLPVSPSFWWLQAGLGFLWHGHHLVHSMCAHMHTFISTLSSWKQSLHIGLREQLPQCDCMFISAHLKRPYFPTKSHSNVLKAESSKSFFDGHSAIHNRNLKHSIQNKSIHSIPKHFLMWPHPSTSKNSGRALIFFCTLELTANLAGFQLHATLVPIPTPFFTIRWGSGKATAFQGPSLLTPFLP